MVRIDGRPDGAVSADGRVQEPTCMACSPAMPFAGRGWPISASASSLAYESRIEAALDALADHLEAHLDIEQILKIARSRQATSASAA